MKYFIDTEFLEGTQKEKFPISMFRKETKPIIDLISIGIVAEEKTKYVGCVDPISSDAPVQINKYIFNREYYAISKEFNLKEAWNRYQLDYGSGDQRNNSPKKVYWIRENVLKKIWDEFYIDAFGANMPPFCYKGMESLINRIGKTNKQIAEEVKMFVYQDGIYSTNEIKPRQKDIEFYAYYADYDWVAFCWLFGKMIDLPKGFPMYCNDLKQMLDEIQLRRFGNALSTDGNLMNNIKKLPGYPEQNNEHSALVDARWNKKLYEFLKTF